MIHQLNRDGGGQGVDMGFCNPPSLPSCGKTYKVKFEKVLWLLNYVGAGPFGQLGIMSICQFTNVTKSDEYLGKGRRFELIYSKTSYHAVIFHFPFINTHTFNKQVFITRIHPVKRTAPFGTKTTRADSTFEWLLPLYFSIRIGCILVLFKTMYDEK